MQTIERLESEVRSDCRSLPTVFDTARGARLTDREGRSILETAGPEGGVAKGMPPLTIDEVSLEEGLALLTAALDQVAEQERPS